MSFETDLQALEKIVQALSSGEKTLDESVELYKDGLTLTKKCYKHLQTVEKAVQVITQKDGSVRESEFAG
ncbi:MAG: exodeoxyribonuclease VII small subunit [Candidatus Margulisbacteria bacterium]|jgi:exodeoxyribonuclease VII small subunit|nr:exodeoxyribonuclease VII small subunit [Candidatus Margulisiibacteriota bacterium]